MTPCRYRSKLDSLPTNNKLLSKVNYNNNNNNSSHKDLSNRDIRCPVTLQSDNPFNILNTYAKFSNLIHPSLCHSFDHFFNTTRIELSHSATPYPPWKCYKAFEQPIPYLYGKSVFIKHTFASVNNLNCLRCVFGRGIANCSTCCEADDKLHRPIPSEFTPKKEHFSVSSIVSVPDS